MATLKGTIQLDTSAAVKALQGLAGEGNKSAKSITEDFKKSLSGGVGTSEAAKAFNGVRAAANAAVSEQKSALATLIATGQQGSKAFEAAKNSLISATKEAKRLDEALEQVDKEIDGVNSKKISIGDKLKEGLSGSNLASSITGGLIGGGIAGAIQTGAGLIISGFKSVIDVGSQYETALASVSAVTGVSGAGLDDLGSRAQGLAAKFGGSATTQLSAFQTVLSKFGPDLAKSPEALSKVSESVNILAKAAGLDAAQSVDVLSNAMLQFGVDASDPANLAKESARFINVLAASAKEGASEIPQVGAAILAAGVAAKGANLSFEETNAAVQALAIGGKEGAEAGTGLRNVIGKLLDGGKEQSALLKTIGLDYKTLGTELTTNGLQPALAKLKAGIDTLGSSQEKSVALTTLFGLENSNTAGILLNNVEKIKAFTTAMTGTSEASKQAETNMATFAEFSSRVSGMLGNIQIGIFQAFSDFADLITGTLQPVIAPLVESIGGAFERIWSIVKPILMGIGGIIIAQIVIQIQYAAAVVRTFVELFNRMFDTIMRSIQPAIDAVKKLFGIDGEFGKGIDVMELFKQALAFVGESFTMISDIVVEVGGLVFEFLLTPLQAVISVIAGVVTKVKEWFFSSKESNEENKKGKGILETLREAFSNIRGTIAGVTEAFREIKTVINEFFSALANLDIKKALEAFTGFGDRVKQAYDRGFDSVQKLKDEQARASEEAEKQKVLLDQQAAAKEKEASGENEALKAAKERYDLAKALAEETRKRADLATKEKQLAGTLTDEQAKIELKKNELALQDQLIAAYETAFKVIKDDAGFVAKVGFSVNKAELTGIKNEFDALLLKQTDLRIDIGAGVDVKAIEKSTKETIKRIQDLFKDKQDALAESLIDPAEFEARTKELEASLGQTLKGLQDQLNSAEVKANPKIAEAIQEQVDLVNVSILNLQKAAQKSLANADEASTKERIDRNKRTIEILKEDEANNAQAIRALLEENLQLETERKLRGVKGTEQARIEETRIILREAEIQADAIAKKYASIPELSELESIGLSMLNSISKAFESMGSEQTAAREAAIAGLKQEEEDLKASLKNKELSISEFYAKQADLAARKSETQNTGIPILDAIKNAALQTASTKLAEFTAKSKKSFDDFAAKGELSFESLGLVAAGVLGQGLAEAVKTGDTSLQAMLANVAKAAISALDMLIPVITAQYLGFLGVFGAPLAFIAVQGLKALLNSAVSSVGADQGVVGITENYKVKPSSRDTIPVMMRRGESAIVPEATEKNRGILEYFNSTRGRWQDYAIKNLSRDEMAKALNLHTLGITFEREMPRIDIASQPQVVVLQQNNEMLSRELKGLRKEIKNLKSSIRTQQEVHVYPHVDPNAIVTRVEARRTDRKRGH